MAEADHVKLRIQKEDLTKTTWSIDTNYRRETEIIGHKHVGAEKSIIKVGKIKKKLKGIKTDTRDNGRATQGACATRDGHLRFLV